MYVMMINFRVQIAIRKYETLIIVNVNLSGSALLILGTENFRGVSINYTSYSTSQLHIFISSDGLYNSGRSTSAKNTRKYRTLELTLTQSRCSVVIFNKLKMTYGIKTR